MANPAKLEITIKITELPTDVTIKKANGWKEFTVECEGRSVAISLRPRAWNKLEEAQTKYPLWVAAITGQLGQQQGKKLELLEPSVQVFEKKARPPKDAQTDKPEGEPPLAEAAAAEPNNDSA